MATNTDRKYADDPVATEQLEALRARIAELEGALIGAVIAWETLKEGYYKPKEVQLWLADKMKPAMDKARQDLASDSSKTKAVLDEAREWRQIYKDLEDFDGDKRSHLSVLEDAKVKLIASLDSMEKADG